MERMRQEFENLQILRPIRLRDGGIVQPARQSADHRRPWWSCADGTLGVQTRGPCLTASSALSSSGALDLTPREPWLNGRVLSGSAGWPAQCRHCHALPRLSGVIWRLRRDALLLCGDRVLALSLNRALQWPIPAQSPSDQCGDHSALSQGAPFLFTATEMKGSPRPASRLPSTCARGHQRASSPPCRGRGPCISSSSRRVISMSGPIGAGKTSVAKELIKLLPAPLSDIEGIAAGTLPRSAPKRFERTGKPIYLNLESLSGETRPRISARIWDGMNGLAIKCQPSLSTSIPSANPDISNT